jgi:dihydroneopterin aldolase/2-amino-4-hydroxy-6-hydroxymethyldihydropteridine diphosphokinase/dihydropteroate synthase
MQLIFGTMICEILFGSTRGMMVTTMWPNGVRTTSRWMGRLRYSVLTVGKQNCKYHRRRWFSSSSSDCAEVGAGRSSSRDASKSLLQNMAYISVGSNMGDRFRNIHQAMKLLSSPSSVMHQALDRLPSPSIEEDDDDEDEQIEIQITRTSFLYETQPMYFADQPPFLNGAVQIYTSLSPVQLLHKCKLVERLLGRDDTVTPIKGPRPIDLDILLYYENHTNGNLTSSTSIQFENHELHIPHPDIAEREFVLQPMVELDPYAIIPYYNNGNKTILEALRELKREDQQIDNEENACVRVLPLPRNRVLKFGRYQTIIMGILNVTPDSFSDGGKVRYMVNQVLIESFHV